MSPAAETVVANCKSLASWLERLPPGATLLDPNDEMTVLVADPRLTAMHLRLWLPAEGHG